MLSAIILTIYLDVLNVTQRQRLLRTWLSFESVTVRHLTGTHLHFFSDIKSSIEVRLAVAVFQAFNGKIFVFLYSCVVLNM